MRAPRWTGAALKEFARDGTRPDGDPEEREPSKAAVEFAGALSGALRRMRKQEGDTDNQSEEDTEE